MMNRTKWDVIVVGLGDLGSRVAQACHEQGLKVLGIRRQTVSKDYPTLAMDIHSDAWLSGNLSSRCLVYAIAADQRTPAGYQAAYPQGLALARQTIAADQCIFVSSTRIYGQTGPDWIDEQTTPRPADWAGEALLEAETHLNDGDCALALGGIYGPGRDRMLQLAMRGGWCQPGHFSNRIQIHDAARLTQLLVDRALNGQPLPRRVIGVDGEGADMAEVLEWCREQLHVSAQPHAEFQPPAGKRCRSVLFDELGFSCQFPDFRAGYRALLAHKDLP